jgi:hypothetical protein
MPPLFWLQVGLQTLTLFFLLVGLIGLLLPIFPGLTVMWLATLGYALFEHFLGRMDWSDWLLFALITACMLIGNVVDNLLIAHHTREKKVPWSSIFLGFLAGIVASVFFTPLIGLLASPAALYAAEYLRLRQHQAALASTRAWLTGWGWSLVARLGIGVVMTGLWMLSAWF